MTTPDQMTPSQRAHVRNVARNKLACAKEGAPGSDTEAERSMWGFVLESYAETPPKKRATKKRTRKRAAK